MDITSIPKKYGGDLDFECGMMPSIDPAIRNCLSLKSPELEKLFLTGPTRWVDGEDGEMTALSVGSMDGKEHKEEVATLHSWATRVATGSSTFQTRRTQPEYAVPGSTPLSQTTSQVGLASQSRPQSSGNPITEPALSSSQAQPQVQSYAASTAVSPESESTVPNGAVFKSEPLTGNGQINGRNGTPSKIAMPPTQMQRTETQYMTPASDPSELRQLQ